MKPSCTGSRGLPRASIRFKPERTRSSAALCLAAATLLCPVLAGVAWAQQFGRPVLPFEINRGQLRAEVDFAARGSGYAILLNAGGVELAVTHARGLDAVRMEILGGNPAARFAAQQPLAGRVNYLRGGSPDGWVKDIPTYRAVRYHDVYPGIDVVYYGNERQLEYDFHVAAGADPAEIRLRFAGSRAVRREPDGRLAVELAHGTAHWERPVAYQLFGDRREPVAAEYGVSPEGEVRFEVAAYDRARPLVIDPVLGYSTYFGGSGRDIANAIALDSEGSVYVTGSTASMNIRVSPPYQSGGAVYSSAFGGGASDVFVMKLSAAGEFVYSTYIGGEGEDRAYGIAVDAQRRAVVVGATMSAGFPADEIARGFGDGFLVRLGEQGFPLASAVGAWSRFLGGGGFDQALAVAVDSGGNIWTAGVTFSENLSLASATQSSHGDRGFFGDAFVTKHSTGGALLVQTYLGGNDVDVGIASETGFKDCAIAVDAAGNAYVAGLTFSTNFPTTPGVYQPIKRGSIATSDGFITKFSPGGARLWSTCIGGSSNDTIKAIAVDAFGAVYVAGTTSSNDFPVTTGSFGSAAVSGSTGFVAKLNAAGTALLYSGRYGSSTTPRGITVNAAGEAIIAATVGVGGSIPVVSGTASAGGAEVAVAKITASGSALVYSTYFGGRDNEDVGGLAIDGASNVYLAGSTTSDNFPIASAIQATRAGAADVFVARLLEGSARLINLSTRARIPLNGDLTPGFVISGTGTKTLLVRAIGPGLAQFGVPGVIADPRFELIPLGGTQVVASNNDWGGSAALMSAFTAVGAFPLQGGSRDAAALVTLAAGAYTVRATNAAGAVGEGLVEIYDADPANPAVRLVNLSARATLTTAGERLVPGFVVTGNQPKQMLIRAIGPGLAQFGVPGVLSDPELALIPLGGSTAVAANNDWGGTAGLTAAFTATGAFALPADSRDAATLITLQPGGYTVEVTGVGNATGVVLVEVYEMP